jgi:hypothetical protein
MRHPAQVSLDRMRFPLTLADGLQAAFADFVSNPLPERLAALLRRLSVDCDERSGEPTHGASVTMPAVDVWLLIQAGWPREALLVTLVREKKEEGHAVLTVTTDRGDYVLDNQTADILLCSRTGYRFVKRQSQSNLSVWVSHDLRPAVASLTLNARLERQGRCRVGQRRGRRLASFG